MTKKTNCIICDTPTSEEYLFCANCYREKVKKIRNQFNHNRQLQQIKDHYFDLRGFIEKKNNNEFNDNICLMFALAEEAYNIYDDNYLLKRVVDDILKANNKKSVKACQTNFNGNNFNDKDFREVWPREHQCEDGHYVRSLSEMLIDNWLYNNGYLHAYEKSVFMDSDPDAVVLSDFYLPKGNVYIEFWGYDDNEKYLKRKAQKIKLYDDNNISRIDLDESHIKRLNDVMPRMLAQYIKKNS